LAIAYNPDNFWVYQSAITIPRSLTPSIPAVLCASH